jgi:hypothetical protein
MKTLLATEGWRAVCGDVRNVGRVPARSVAYNVTILGAAWGFVVQGPVARPEDRI